MAIRRPRIKAAANLLNIKRKKLETDVQKPTQNEPYKTTIKDEKPLIETKPQGNHVVQVKPDVSVSESSLENAPDVFKSSDEECESKHENIASDDNNTFKEPPKVLPHNDTVSMLSEEILNKDLMSPNKQQHIRARMRPPPFMAQRRNSYVASSPSPHTGSDVNSEFALPSPRREKHYSLSSISSLALTPLNVHSRARTESACSSSSELISSMAANANKTASKTRRQTNNDHFIRLQWRRDYESRCANGVPDKTRLKMLDLLFYNPSNNPMELNLKKDQVQKKTSVKKEPEKQLDESESKSVNVVVPQLKLNSDNELVLDDKSLIIETTAEHEARKMLANRSLVFVDENTGMNGFYKKQKRTREWPEEETMKFYRCLQTIGTDFSLMQQLFPKRTRRELKLKFKKEERINGLLINKALLHPKKFNISELEQQLQSEDHKLEEEQKKWKEIQQKDALRLIQDKKDTKSAGARALSCGSLVYENEDVLQKKAGSRSIITNYVISENTQTSVTQETKQALKTHVEKALATRILKSSSNETQEKTQQKEKCKKSSSTNSRAVEKHTKKSVAKSSKKIKQEQSLCVVSANEMDKKDNNIPYEVVCSNNSTIPSNFHNEELDVMSSIVEHKPAAENLEQESKTKILVDLDNGNAIQIFDDDYISEVKNESLTLNSRSVSTKEEVTISDVQCFNNPQELHTIEKVLEQIEDGGLMLVSSIDPENTDNVIHEIYMIDKESGDLCDQPLDLPDDILQAVIELVS